MKREVAFFKSINLIQKDMIYPIKSAEIQTFEIQCGRVLRFQGAVHGQSLRIALKYLGPLHSKKALFLCFEAFCSQIPPTRPNEKSYAQESF